MKTNYTVFKIVALTLLFTCNSWAQTTLAQWNFNGSTNTQVPGGATSPLTATGAGTLQLIGGLTASTTFPAGVSSTTGLGSSDPVNTTPQTNFAWGTTTYAALGTENKQRGIQVNVSTFGYADITFRFDQRLSNKAGNTYVVQYTTDRTIASPVWIDAQTFTFTPADIGTGDVWYNLRSVNLSTITGLNNNANAAFRIVGAFDPITGNYLASTSGATASPYDGTGIVRYDMVTVTAATTLGVSQFERNRNEFKIYPNPSDKEIVTLSQTQDITVSDVSGKVVFKGKNVSTIDTKSFTTGVYFIKTKTGITRKLIVK